MLQVGNFIVESVQEVFADVLTIWVSLKWTVVTDEVLQQRVLLHWLFLKDSQLYRIGVLISNIAHKLDKYPTIIDKQIYLFKKLYTYLSKPIVITYIDRMNMASNSQDQNVSLEPSRGQVEAGQIVEDAEPETQHNQDIEQENMATPATPSFGPVPMETEQSQPSPCDFSFNQQIAAICAIPAQKSDIALVRTICLTEIKEKIVKIIPSKASQIEGMTIQQICDYYEMIKDDQLPFRLQDCSQQCHASSLARSAANLQPFIQEQHQITDKAVVSSVQPIEESFQQNNYTEQAFAPPIRKIQAQQRQAEPEKQYPTDSQMRNELLDMLPQLRQELNRMGTAELRKTYDLALEQKKNIRQFKEIETIVQPDQSQMPTDPVQNTQATTMEVEQNIAPVEQNNQGNIKQVAQNEQPIVNTSPEVNLQQGNPVVDKIDAARGSSNEAKNIDVDQILKAVAARYPALEQTFKTLSKEDIISAYEKVMGGQKDKQRVVASAPSPSLLQTQKQQQQMQRSANEAKNSNTAPPLSQGHIVEQDKTLKGDVSSKKVSILEATSQYSQRQKPQQSYQQSEPSMKRNHETMMSTNSTRPKRNGQLSRLAQQKQSKVQQRKRLSKVKISELRKKLIAKSPELKNKIMQMTDQEMERIFIDCMNKQEETKKTVPVGSKRTVQGDSKKGQAADKMTQREVFKNKTDKASTELIELSSQARKKKCRTMVLMHTEEDYSDEDEVMNGSKKVRVSDHESITKCQCECCKKNESIPAIFKKIIDCYVKQSSQ